MRSVLDFFATAQSLFSFFVLATEAREVQTLQDSLKVRRDQRCMIPTTLWGKSPFEVAENVIGRPKDTSSWAGSESEYRDAVCVGVLRNSATSWPLSFGRETSLHHVVHGITLGSEHSRQSPASHGFDWPHFRVSDSHLGIAGQVTGKSSDTQCTFRKFLKKYGGVFICRELHVH